MLDSLDSIQQYDTGTADKAQHDCMWTSDKNPLCSDLIGQTDFIKINRKAICSYRPYDSIF